VSRILLCNIPWFQVFPFYIIIVLFFVAGFSDKIESINKTADKARGIIMASSHTGPIYNRLSQLKKGAKTFIHLI